MQAFKLFILLILFAFIAFPVQARDKEAFSGDLQQPYLENGKHTQNTQWYGKNWYADDWLSQYDNPLDLIDGFYKADIFRDQKMEEEQAPTLVVGPNFYHLSGYDKRRVTHVLDVVYNVTEGDGARMFKLQDWRTGNIIGIYTAQGLQIQ